ncbi:DCC1-like thiol-disulfide oxidoreductase family protein [Vulgatibacter incomptus]|uniref:HTTM-like domain-containing protein n=1 Tax=Vulgatibacter incomptus TaxID=1391653 RepID=A0A0K1PA69_9BACT|nr:DCC1-like thiol-disulfide oxidoreductase family protein [Vulgatibacter incomptus]AKU90014.1 hypothetical protein AKJ08_0401 [Vulgatibacter incomptus]
MKASKNVSHASPMAVEGSRSDKASIGTRLRDTWFSLDPRSLGLFRIGFATLLLGDLLRRLPDLVVWYSNDGLIPNHTQLWRPAARWIFSVFFLASTPTEAAIGFLLCGLSFLGLLIGWKTRLFQLLSLIATISLHSRGVILVNGGDVTMNLLAAWSLFLPLGRRFSVDSLLASLRERPASTAADLAQGVPSPVRPVVSLAAFGLLLQLAVIYFFNAIHKGGNTWMEGSVVHYVLQRDGMVTWLGYQLRDHLPMWLGKALTWSTLALEAAAPALILTPWGTTWARRVAMIALPAMHMGFALFLNVGFFSPAMCAFYPLLLSAADWDAASRFLRKRVGPRTVFFDASCGICFQTARLLTAMDRLGRLRFVDNADASLFPPGVTPELVERTVVVVDDQGRQHTRSAAFASIFRAIPGGFPIAVLLSAPGLRALADRVYDLVASNRVRISTGLGLAACGLPRATFGSSAQATPPAPFAIALRSGLGWAREALVLVFLLSVISQILVENSSIPRWLKLPQPTVFRALVAYGRFGQGWSMFAPNAPDKDWMVVVDALTVDGRRIDPFNFAAFGYDGPALREVPDLQGMNQFWFDYSTRIKDNPAYHHTLEGWILEHHKRTGKPADRIVAFEVALLEDRSPRPGSSGSTDVRRTVFLRHGNLDGSPDVVAR